MKWSKIIKISRNIDRNGWENDKKPSRVVNSVKIDINDLVGQLTLLQSDQNEAEVNRNICGIKDVSCHNKTLVKAFS